MRIREFQLDELERARKLQEECVKLHIPSPPVLHWNYEIKNTDNEIVEIGRGKANSYTRNALNILSCVAGMCSGNLITTSNFGDGYISFKGNTGGVMGVYSNFVGRYSPLNDAVVYIGSDTSPESIDNYLFPIIPLTAGTNFVVSSFDVPSRKLITYLSRYFVNKTGGIVNITESALCLTLGSITALYVRDVFQPIAVASGETMIWTYTTEVAYPNL